MPTFYNFRQNGVDYRFDDIFVPADLFREGTLFTWGLGTNGQLGNATVTSGSTPVTTFSGGNNWKQVSSGGSHTAAVKTDGTLWTWGNGANGRLGNAVTTGNISTPVTTSGGQNNWKQVSSGGSHTAAIKTDGILWSWGNGANGRLGTNATTTESSPVTPFVFSFSLDIITWKEVSAGYSHTSAIKTDGTLLVWGSGSSGQLGNAVTTDISRPVTTFAGGTNWKQVSSGGFHTAAIKTDGTLWIWGSNSTGQLGNADTTTRSTPVTTFAGGTNWKQVSSGTDHTSAVKTDGTLWTWGNGGDGRLGNAVTTGTTSTPVTTFSGGNNWKQVSSGGSHTAAVKTDGTLWTWGSGGNGQLGNAVTTNISTPVTTFSGGTNWKQVSSGSQHTAATTYDDPVI
jgi:alpha-tubulin suppressor-like RCC1 family protein